MNKISFVILSYNEQKITQECIDSIRHNCKNIDYELIVIDNASSDGSAEWLLEQKDIKVKLNNQNVGFPRGCNEGIELADPNSDIFLLNNDTLVPPNAVETLQEALYSCPLVGAVGPMSNACSNYQAIEEINAKPQDYLRLGEKYIHKSTGKEYEKKLYLVAFALLIKREVINKIGLLDERFSPGNFEDNDLGLRIQQAGYENILCHNSLIFHYGSKSFKKERVHDILQRNCKKFEEKWGMHPYAYSYIHFETLAILKSVLQREEVSILEVGCGTGSTLARLHYEYPKMELHGVERNGIAANCAASYFDIVEGDIEDSGVLGKLETYDYILLEGVLEFVKNPVVTLRKMKPLLRENGMIIGSVHDVASLEYVFDRENRCWYTPEAVIELANEAECRIIDMSFNRLDGQVNQYIFSMKGK